MHIVESSTTQVYKPHCAGFVCIELIFFIVASMGLRFGFVLKTELLTRGCFS